MIKSNLHTHTKYSDGRNTMEEMIRSALDKGFVSLGFSDHGFTWFDQSYCISKEGELAYRKEIAELKKKYAGTIDIFAGIEMDCDAEPPDYDYDYTIGSVHYIKAGGEYHAVDMGADRQRKIVDDYFGGSFTDMAKAYFERATELIIAKKPDIVGHLDLITKYSFFNMEDPVYRDAALAAVREIMKHCIRFEMNTGAIARGLRTTPYPADFILEEICRLGGQITIESDCHDADKLDIWYREGEALLRKIGFRSVSRLTKNGFVEDAL